MTSKWICYESGEKVFGETNKRDNKEIYNSQFDTEFVIYTPFSNDNELTADLKKLLQLKENKKEHTIEPKIKNKLYEFLGYYLIRFIILKIL